jgi:predicted Zn-dependent peptidase
MPLLKYIKPITVILMFISAKNLASQAKVEFEEFDLDNGLHVILHKDDANPIVSLDVWYHVGAKDEDSGRTGFAHLFEHMMFQGSENVGKAQHFEYIQKAGGTLNGTTNLDRTNYFETAPSNQLELLLWLESDRMATLKVNQENFDNQREVVKEEKRQRYDNVPYGSRWGELMKRAFKGQTYEWIPIGSMEDLNSADLSYAQKFYRKYYSPDNAVLVVSGDIDYVNAKALVRKYFGALEPSNAKKNAYKKIIFNQGEIKDVIYDNVQLPAVYFGYKTPGAGNNDNYALEIISMILAGGKSSRLYSSLVYEKKLAKQVSSFVWDNELGGMLTISAIGLKNSSPEEIEKEISSQMDKLISGVSDKELEKVKNSIENDFVNNLQTTMRKADFLAYYWTYFKNTGLINTAIVNYLSVTCEDIISTAKKYLNPDNRVILHYLPKKENKVN